MFFSCPKDWVWCELYSLNQGMNGVAPLLTFSRNVSVLIITSLTEPPFYIYTHKIHFTVYTSIVTSTPHPEMKALCQEVEAEADTSAGFLFIVNETRYPRQEEQTEDSKKMKMSVNKTTRDNALKAGEHDPDHGDRHTWLGCGTSWHKHEHYHVMMQMQLKTINRKSKTSECSKSVLFLPSPLVCGKGDVCVELLYTQRISKSHFLTKISCDFFTTLYGNKQKEK